MGYLLAERIVAWNAITRTQEPYGLARSVIFEKGDYYMLVLRAQRSSGTWKVWTLILFIIAACAIYRWHAASPYVLA
jgi:hypothetical protein